MTVATEVDLSARAMQTLLACWDENARGASGASLEYGPGVAAAIFPAGPERAVYNNAVLDRGLASDERIDALDAMAALYAAARIDDYRAWVHESDGAMRTDLERWGYRLAETTRAMGMALDGLGDARPDIELGPPDWDEYLRLVGVAPDFLRDADRSAFHIVVARLDGEGAATGMAYDAADDCGIYNVGTVEHARRRGLGTALTAQLLHDARDRGQRTATLQSTPMGERVYAALGFRDLGRILEYAPPGAPSPDQRL
jgi:ribosomal protein S18 acetylase RimI-like enzyme